MKKIVISTGGGDAPGLNAVIFAVVQSAHLRGWEVYGSRSGYKGLLDLDELVRLTPEKVADITPTGGTILGSSRTNPYKDSAEDVDKLIATFYRLGFDALVAIGGDHPAFFRVCLANVDHH